MIATAKRNSITIRSATTPPATPPAERPLSKPSGKTTKRLLRALDLDTRYYRIVVWNADKEVQWLIQCRPEFEARCYAQAVNGRTEITGYRAQLVPIHLPRLPSYPLGKLD